MKNESVRMEALHRKLDVVLVQILPYNCSETNYIFARIRPPPQAGLGPIPGCGFHHQTPLALPLFFRSAAPASVDARTFVPYRQ